MNKKFFLLFSIPFIIGSCIGCSPNKKGKIQLIYSKTYGRITPIDIYEVIDGYMFTSKTSKEQKTYPLEKAYSYCSYTYSEDKLTSLYDTIHLLDVSTHTLKITFDSIHFWQTRELLYYSEFWGEKETVHFYTNIKHKKTYHIQLKEKSDTYKLTYYDINNSTGLYEINSINDYQKTIEVLKTDITKIEYF